MTTAPIDYDALAKKYGGVLAQEPSPTPANGAQSIDYDALAKKYGGVLASEPDSKPKPQKSATETATKPPTDYDALAAKHGGKIDPASISGKSIYDATIAEGQSPERAQQRVGQYDYAIKQGFSPENAAKFAYSLHWKDAPKKVLSDEEKANVAAYGQRQAEAGNANTWGSKDSAGYGKQFAEGYAYAKAQGWTEDEAQEYAESNPQQRAYIRAGKYLGDTFDSVAATVGKWIGSDTFAQRVTADKFADTEKEARDTEFRTYRESQRIQNYVPGVLVSAGLAHGDAELFAKAAAAVDEHLANLVGGFANPRNASIIAATGGLGLAEAGGAAEIGEAAEAADETSRAYRAGKAFAGVVPAEDAAEALKYAENGEKALKAVQEARIPISAQKTARTIQKLLHVGFTVQMAQGVAESGEAGVKAVKDKDYPEALGYAVDALVNGWMTGQGVVESEARSRIEKALDETAKELYGDKPTESAAEQPAKQTEGRSSKKPITRFGQLNDFEQAAVINKMIEDSPEAAKAADQAEKNAKKYAKLLNYKYNRALQEAWNPNAAQRAIRKIYADRAELERKNQFTELQQAIQEAVKNKEKVEAEEAAKRQVLAKETAAAREKIAQTRKERENSQAEEPVVEAEALSPETDESGHVYYRTMYLGQEATVGVSSKGDSRLVYMRLPDGSTVYLSPNMEFGRAKDAAKFKDQAAADTAAQLAHLYRNNLHEAVNGSETAKAKSERFAELSQQLLDGEITPEQARHRAGIPGEPRLPDAYDAALEGRLTGPYFEGKYKFVQEAMAKARDLAGDDEEQYAAILANLDAQAYQDTIGNLNHVSKSGDFIEDPDGKRWELNAEGKLVSEDREIPLMRDGFYTPEAMRRAAYGRVGYGQETLEEKRERGEREEAARKAVESIDPSMLATEADPNEEKAARQEAYRRKQFGVGIEKPEPKEGYEGWEPPLDPTFADALVNISDANWHDNPGAAERLARRIAENAGIPFDQFMLAKLGMEDSPAGTIARLNPGDTITDSWGKVWTVTKRGKNLFVEAGGAKHQLNPLKPEAWLVDKVKTAKEVKIAKPWTEDQFRKVAYDTPHYVRQQEDIAKTVRDQPNNPEPPQTKQEAEKRYEDAEIRRRAAEAVAVRSAYEAANPATTDEEEAHAKVDKAEEDRKTAREAAAQSAKAEGEIAQRDEGGNSHVQRAPAPVVSFGNEDYVDTDAGPIPVRHALVDIEALVPSFRFNGSNLEWTEGYPRYAQKINPTPEQATSIIADADPANYKFYKYADPGNGPERGPSIVDSGLIVYGGNRRLLKMLRHIENIKSSETNLALFKDKLRELAERNGIRDYPIDDRIYVDVRMMTEPIETVARATEMGKVLNDPETEKMEAALESSMYGRLLKEADAAEREAGITSPILDSISARLNEANSLNDAIDQDPDFFAKVVRDYFKIGRNEWAVWGKPGTNELSEDGRKRLNNALLATVLNDPSSLSEIYGTPAYRAATKAVGVMSKLRSFPDRDVTKKIAETLAAVAATEGKRVDGDSPRERWNATYRQKGLFDLSGDMLPEPDIMVEAMWRALHDKRPTRFRTAINDLMSNQADSLNLFAPSGDELKNPVEFFNQAFREELEAARDARGVNEAVERGHTQTEAVKDYLRGKPWAVTQRQFEAALEGKNIDEVEEPKSPKDETTIEQVSTGKVNDVAERLVDALQASVEEYLDPSNWPWRTHPDYVEWQRRPLKEKLAEARTVRRSYGDTGPYLTLNAPAYFAVSHILGDEPYWEAVTAASPEKYFESARKFSANANPPEYDRVLRELLDASLPNGSVVLLYEHANPERLLPEEFFHAWQNGFQNGENRNAAIVDELNRLPIIKKAEKLLAKAGYQLDQKGFSLGVEATAKAATRSEFADLATRRAILTAYADILKRNGVSLDDVPPVVLPDVADIFGGERAIRKPEGARPGRGAAAEILEPEKPFGAEAANKPKPRIIDPAPPKPGAVEDLAEAKAKKGYVTPDELKKFLQGWAKTKEHANEIYRTAEMMAKHIARDEGIPDKEALDWVLRQRLAGIRFGDLEGKRGRYHDPNIEQRFANGILELHKAADASTFIHEFAHVVFPLLSDEDLRAINTIPLERINKIDKGARYPAWNGDRKSLEGDAYAGLSERFAYGLEQFLRDENPTGFTAEVKAVLKKIKDMMKAIYQGFVGDPLSPWRNTEESREVFSNMFGITDFDLADVWDKEVARAKAAEKKMPAASQAWHPESTLVAEIGRGLDAKVFAAPQGGTKLEEEGVVNLSKPLVSLSFDSATQASQAFANAVKAFDSKKISGVELRDLGEGRWAVQFNTRTNVALNQDLPLRRDQDPQEAIKQDNIRHEAFYLKSERLIQQKMRGPMPGDDVAKMLRNNGVKPDEMKWTGLDEFLAGKNKVTPEEVQQHLAESGIKIEEVTKGQPDEQGWGVEGEQTKYDSYVLPGGENYRELLLTMPDIGPRDTRIATAQKKRSDAIDKVRDLRLQLETNNGVSTIQLYNQIAEAQKEVRIASDELAQLGNKENDTYISGHWDEPNILAHIRFNERATPDGKRLLHLEEIQSDWHQKGRKQGYADPEGRKRQLKEAGKKAADAFDDSNNAIYEVGKLGFSYARDAREVIREDPDWAQRWDVSDPAIIARIEAWAIPAREVRRLEATPSTVPDAPFKKDWHEMSFRRMVRMAAEQGFDGMSWTPGEKQAERYDLSKQIDRLTLHDDGTLRAYSPTQGRIINRVVDEDELPDLIGKEAARKLMEQPAIDGLRELKGLDLKMGGEGMRGFYDKIIPEYANKFGKRWNAKVERTSAGSQGRMQIERVPNGWEVTGVGNNARYFYVDDDEAGSRDEAKRRAEQFIQKHGPQHLDVPYLPVNAEMKRSVMQEGVPLFQALPQTHLGVQLEEAKKELAKTPVWKTVARTILQMKIERLENEIRAKYGAEPLEPKKDDPELAKQFVKEVKDERADAVRARPDGVSGDKKPKGIDRIPGRPVLGVSDDAASAGLGGRRGLGDARPLIVEPLKNPRGEPVGKIVGDEFDQKEWDENNRKAGLPPLPAPTWALESGTSAALSLPGQSASAQTALSALQQSDGVVVANQTGAGKTRIAMAIIKEFGKDADEKPLVLFITKNKRLAKKAASTGETYFGLGFEMDQPKAGASGGNYATTYQQLLKNPVYATMPWDLVVADESGEARNWFKEPKKGQKINQGQALKAVMNSARKGVYMSATPFHAPMEYGYLDKLGLWPKGKFNDWLKQNFTTYTDNGKLVARLDPMKQAMLRKQLIDRGQLIAQALSYDGFNAHFGVVPVTLDMLRGLGRIAVGFEQARTKYNSMGRPEMAKNLSAYEATYTKTFVERQKLPQAVELAKTGLDLGYQVIIASEQTGEDLFHRDRDGEPSEYQKLDDLMGGQLKRTLPNLPNVFDTLREEFGDKVGNYSGGDSPEREKVREEFLRGNLPLVYMSMKAGAIGTDWHDADYPELGIKGGDKPRLMIVLGPPYSGVLLEQLMGRPWRYGVKSNVHMVFLGTDAEPDIRLMQTKIGPRMRALRASVHGERDSLAAAMDNYSQEEKNRMRQDMLAYQEGDEAEVSTSEYKVRSKGTTAAIQNWSAIEFPLAQESKRKVPPSSRYALIEWQLRHQGTGGEVPWQDIDQLRLQLEQAKKELAKTPVWKTVARTILQMKIERLENEIRAKYGAETRPHEAQTEGIPGEEDCNPKPLTNLSEAVFHEAGFRIGEAPRPFKEGMRRLAIFSGLLGAVAGGFCAHKALHSVPSQRYQHRVFERLSALDIVKQRRAALISESARGANFDWPFATDISGPWAVASIESSPADPLPKWRVPRGLTLIPEPGTAAQAAPAPIDYDALAKKYGGVLQSSEPPQLTAPSGLRKPDPSFSASGIKTIYWKPDFTVDFFVMQDGGYVSSEPSPSAWLYLLWAAYPALGFAISWSLIRGTSWVVDGFYPPPK